MNNLPHSICPDGTTTCGFPTNSSDCSNETVYRSQMNNLPAGPSHSLTNVRFLSFATWTICVVFSLAHTGTAQAMTIDPTVAKDEMTRCFAHDDAEVRESANYHGCCSKEMGICVICNTAETECYASNYRRKLPSFGDTKDPRGSSNPPRNNGAGSSGTTPRQGGSSATIGGGGHAIGGGCPGGVC